MKNINSTNELKAAILELEGKHTDEGKQLKEQFNVAFESIKPVNLIKSTLKEATESPDLKNRLLTTSIGFAAGYLSKIAFESFSNSPDKGIYGAVLQQGIQKVVSNNPGMLRSLGVGVLKIIYSQNGHVNGSPENGTKN